jgi:hypothetical protein
MNSLNEIKFHQIIEEVPELTHVLPEQILLELKSHSNSDYIKKPRSAKKILEDIIDNYSNNNRSKGVMNFYPSNISAPCMELCVGVATKKFGFKRDDDKNRTGFKGLITDIIKYWLNCGSVNTRTILYTTDWDPQAFSENWKSIIDTYKAKGKVVKIFFVLDDKLVEVYK